MSLGVACASENGRQLIVDVDGGVMRARVIESVDKALDEELLSAVKKWKFKAAALDGKAVPVAVETQLGAR